jgi:predicted RNA-binding protein with PUA-like domain
MKKAEGTYRARLTARGYEQTDGLHFDSSDTSAPVVNGITSICANDHGWMDSYAT